MKILIISIFLLSACDSEPKKFSDEHHRKVEELCSREDKSKDLNKLCKIYKHIKKRLDI